MLMPKKVKFRKQHRGRRAGMAKGGDYIAFGDFGLQALEPAWVTARQIEAGPYRDQPAREARRQDVDPRVSRQAVHEEAARDPNGQGQGPPEGWVAVVKPGRILFELEGVSQEVAQEAMKLAAQKLCILTKFVSRHSELR